MEQWLGEGWTRTKIKEWLKGKLGYKGYLHSLGTAYSCRLLAQRYGLDPDKAELAGMIHDCAKSAGKGVLLKLAGDFGILIGEIEEKSPDLLHAPVGAKLAGEIFGVFDPAVTRAIATHTTGSARMGLLDKVVYVADYIEPTRIFPGVEEIRFLAGVDLDQAFLAALENTIKYVVGRGLPLHPASVAARNALLFQGISRRNRSGLG